MSEPWRRKVGFWVALTVSVGVGYLFTGRRHEARPILPPRPSWLSGDLRLAAARRFAPHLRFNAYRADGAGRQNRNEDFFPMSVARFLNGCAAGELEVAVVPSTAERGAPPAETAPQRFDPREVVFEPRHLVGFPRYVVGDAPGTAPVYVHVYADPARPAALAADGSGQASLWLEYWLFYAHDRADADILGVTCTGDGDRAGHRGDWEHTAYRVTLTLGAGGALAGGALEEGYYYGHLNLSRIPAAELERVDDAGQPAAAGQHPVVYVAQGKHASYPQAGEWHDPGYPEALGEYTDTFHGNGVWVDTWRGALVDLESEDPAVVASELAPPGFATIAAHGADGQALRDWTEYLGYWGPEAVIEHFDLGCSARGPKAKRDYGDQGDPGRAQAWSAAKERLGAERLRIDVARGLSVARVEPAPAPQRRALASAKAGEAPASSSVEQR